MSIYPACETQIALLFAREVRFLEKYTDFSNIFSNKSIAMLLNSSNINKHIIDIKLNKQLLYRSIYSLGPVKLETFKTYI